MTRLFLVTCIYILSNTSFLFLPDTNSYTNDQQGGVFVPIWLPSILHVYFQLLASIFLVIHCFYFSRIRTVTKRPTGWRLCSNMATIDMTRLFLITCIYILSNILFLFLPDTNSYKNDQQGGVFVPIWLLSILQVYFQLLASIFETRVNYY